MTYEVGIADNNTGEIVYCRYVLPEGVIQEVVDILKNLEAPGIKDLLGEWDRTGLMDRVKESVGKGSKFSHIMTATVNGNTGRYEIYVLPLESDDYELFSNVLV
uniref:Uncharacterized protein n=1 Tax=Dictyoglomus turgidum TaxID=513050 RepID=A0A7C3WRC7_9BACT